MKLAIVHDIAEAIAGDITPSDGLTKEEKFKAELVRQEIGSLDRHDRLTPLRLVSNRTP